MEDETVSLWSKKQDDLTVGDTVKVAVGITVITTAVTFAALGVLAGLGALATKLEKRKAAKLELVNNQEEG